MWTAIVGGKGVERFILACADELRGDQVIGQIAADAAIFASHAITYEPWDRKDIVLAKLCDPGSAAERNLTEDKVNLGRGLRGSFEMPLFSIGSVARKASRIPPSHIPFCEHGQLADRLETE